MRTARRNFQAVGISLDIPYEENLLSRISARNVDRSVSETLCLLIQCREPESIPLVRAAPDRLTPVADWNFRFDYAI